VKRGVLPIQVEISGPASICFRRSMVRRFHTGLLAMALLPAIASAQYPLVKPEPELFPVNRPGESGYVDKTGKLVLRLPPDHHGGPFSEGRARVRNQMGHGFIDATGAFVIPPIYAMAHDFHEGAAVVERGVPGSQQGRQPAVIDRSGKVLFSIPADEDPAWWVQEGLLVVRAKNPPRISAYDMTGKRAFPWIAGQNGLTLNFWEGLLPLHEPVPPDAKPGARGKLGYINRAGEWQIPARYDHGTAFGEGVAAVMQAVAGTQRWTLINTRGETVAEVPGIQDVMSLFSEGRALVGAQNKQCFIDKLGRIVIPCRFGMVGDYWSGFLRFTEGLVPMRITDEVNGWGYIDANGATVIPARYAFAGQFLGGVAEVQTMKVGKLTTPGLIDRTGNWIAEPVELPRVAGGALGKFPRETSAPSMASGAERRIRVRESEMKIVTAPQPKLSDQAKQAGISGNVIFQAMVSAEGNIESIRLITGHRLLIEEAVRVARLRKYQPFNLNGKPQAVETTITIVFPIRKG
jgi:hypothetical protein